MQLKVIKLKGYQTKMISDLIIYKPMFLYTLQRVWKKLFVAFPWVVTSTGPRGLMICVFII